MNVNKKQWNVFAIIFFLGSVFFFYDATLQANSAALEFVSSGATGFYQAQTLRSAIYGSYGVILFILAAAFWISAIFEKDENKKK